MKEFKTIADLQASKQTVTDLMLYCRENNLYYIVQESGYAPAGDDVTFNNGRVGKAAFIADAKYIKTENGNVQDELDSIVSGGLPSQSGNQFKFLSTDGSDAQWVNGQIEVATFAALEALEPESEGIRFTCQSRAGAEYISRPPTYTPLAGDATFANGWFGELQNEDADPVKMGAFATGVSSDSVILNQCLQRYGKINLKSNSFGLDAPIVVDNPKSAIFGDGSSKARLVPRTDFGDVVICGYSTGPMLGVNLRGFTVFSNPASVTSGAAIKMDGVRSFDINDVYIDKGFIGFHFLGCSQGNIDNCYVSFGQDNGGVIAGRRYMIIEETANANITSKHCGDLFFSNLNLRGGGSHYCEYGIQANSGDGIWFDNYHVGNCTEYNILIDANSTVKCTGFKFSNGWHDIGSGGGVSIVGSTPSLNGRHHFTSVISNGSSVGTVGYNIDGSAKDITIGGPGTEIQGYNRQAVLINASYTGNVTLQDAKIYSCGLGSAGTYDAIFDASQDGYTIIKNCEIGGGVSSTFHKYHINSTKTKDTLEIKDNTFLDSGLTGVIDYNESLGVRIEQNKGYNPTGSNSPAVGASPWTFTNTRGFPVRFICNGGAVSDIKINGSSVGAITQIETVLSPSESVTITYTSTPAVYISGM